MRIAMKFYSQKRSTKEILATLLSQEDNLENRQRKALIDNNADLFSSATWEVLALNQNNTGQYENAKCIFTNDEIVKNLANNKLSQWQPQTCHYRSLFILQMRLKPMRQTYYLY